MPSVSSAPVRASATGLQPRTVALGITCTARAGNLKWRGARIGGEIDRGAALEERIGQRLRWKQMAAGPAGGEEDEIVRFAGIDLRRHGRLSRPKAGHDEDYTLSAVASSGDVSMATRGCSRVKASSMPMA